jgi:hypothetical protein
MGGKLTEHDVGKYLVLVHVDMSDGDAQAQDLLELELDSGAHLVELVGEVLVVGYWGRELAGLGETGPKETGDLLDEGLRGKESVVLLGEFLNELLVLVEPESNDMRTITRVGTIRHTSSSHQPTCIRGRSASRDQCRRRLRECRWTCEDEECGEAYPDISVNKPGKRYVLLK